MSKPVFHPYKCNCSACATTISRFQLCTAVHGNLDMTSLHITTNLSFVVQYCTSTHLYTTVYVTINLTKHYCYVSRFHCIITSFDYVSRTFLEVSINLWKWNSTVCAKNCQSKALDFVTSVRQRQQVRLVAPVQYFKSEKKCLLVEPTRVRCFFLS